MPRAPKVCSLCAERSEPGTNRCTAHRREPWAGSDRRSRLPRNWAAIRKRVLDRDGHRCQLRLPGCTVVATEVDHRVAGIDDHRESSLQSACNHCHKIKSASEGAAARGHARRW